MTYLARIEQLATLIHKRTELSWSGSRSLATSLINLPDEMSYRETRYVAKELSQAREALMKIANYPRTQLRFKKGAAVAMALIAHRALGGE